MKKLIILISSVFITSLSIINAQNVWNNNGATVTSTTNAYIIINGGLINQANGTIDNSGTIRLTGDWTNNAANTALINSSPGKVLMDGATQQIIGTSQTVFNRLELAGTGVKQLRSDIDCSVEDSLILNDREFDLDTNTVFVLNTSPGIITRTTGFCSSLTDGGLARNTNSTSAYLYPVGSSVGTARYRPIDVTPNTASINTYKVRMANVDATTEGYNVATKDSALCMVNNLFYHRIYRVNGTSAADLTFYFDSLTDGYYNTSAHWQTVPQWEDMLSTVNLYNVSPVFSTVTKTAWNTFTPNYPYALAVSTPTVNLFTVPTTPTVCQNDTIVFHATNGFINYDFYVNGILAQSSTDSLFATNSLSTGDAINVISTDGRSCDAFSNVISNIIINPLPVVSAISAPNDTLCTGDMLTLSGNGALTYAWDNGVTDAIAFASTVTTTYTVIGTDINGCRDTLQTIITVNPLPIVVANSAPGTTTCAGDMLTLSGSGASSYAWDNGVIDAIAFASTTTTTYTVTGTDANGCINIDQAIITVNSLPIVVANSAPGTTACIGDMLTLSGSGASSYTWDNGITDAIAFASTTTTTYIVTGTDANGCINTDQVLITVNSLPIVVANSAPGTTTCAGDMLTLSGSGASSYAWDNGVIDAIAFASTTTTTYTVTGTDANGCINTDQVIITVNSLPIVVANSAPGTTTCAGDMLTLSGSGASTYAWDNGVIDAVAFASTTTTTYIVTGTDANGCINTDQVLITVNSLPIVQIGAVNDSICAGNSTQITASGSASTYTWNDGSSSTSFNFTPVNDSILILNGIDANGCSNSDTLLISVLIVPIVTPLADVTFCMNESVILTATGTNIVNVVWNNGLTLDDSTSISPTATPMITTTYIVTAFTGTCTDSDTVTVTVNPLPSLNAGNDTTINFGQSIDINAITTGISYSWTPSEGLSCNDCINPTASPQVTTEYYLTVTDALGCTKTDTLLVNIELECIDLFIPNIFTPNGDLDNDVIYVYNSFCIETMTFLIYDRWGNKVFETSDPFQGWDGNYKGGTLESGVYVYVVSAVLTSGTEVLKKGNITLLK